MEKQLKQKEFEFDKIDFICFNKTDNKTIIKLFPFCSKCGITVENRKTKYCGDGSDKDNEHRWVTPLIGFPIDSSWKLS